MSTIEMVSEYLKLGVLEIDSKKDGTPGLRVNYDKAMEHAPDLWNQHLNEIDLVKLSLYNKGVLDMNITDDGIEWSVTEDGRAILEGM